MKKIGLVLLASAVVLVGCSTVDEGERFAHASHLISEAGILCSGGAEMEIEGDETSHIECNFAQDNWLAVRTFTTTEAPHEYLDSTSAASWSGGDGAILRGHNWVVSCIQEDVCSEIQESIGGELVPV